jgi:hypothetical protein
MRRWTAAEDAALDEGLAANETSAEIAATRLPGRTRQQIDQRCQVRGIKRRYLRWTPERVAAFTARWRSGAPLRVLRDEFDFSNTSSVSVAAKRLRLKPRGRGFRLSSPAALAITRALAASPEPLTWPQLRAQLPPRIAANPRTRRALIHMYQIGKVTTHGQMRHRVYALAVNN